MNNLHHITWIDLHNQTFEDELVGEFTKASIEHYEKMGFAQKLSSVPVKEEAK